VKEKLWVYKKVEVWAEDEHRVGLKPILRKILAPVNQRPSAIINPRYEWLWLIAFAEPKQDAIVGLLFHTWMQKFLNLS
jgi:hypothetical protein